MVAIFVGDDTLLGAMNTYTSTQKSERQMDRGVYKKTVEIVQSSFPARQIETVRCFRFEVVYVPGACIAPKQQV